MSKTKRGVKVTVDREEKIGGEEEYRVIVDGKTVGRNQEEKGKVKERKEEEKQGEKK